MRVLPEKLVGDPDSSLFTHVWSDGSDRVGRLRRGAVATAAAALAACRDDPECGSRVVTRAHRVLQRGAPTLHWTDLVPARGGAIDDEFWVRGVGG